VNAVREAALAAHRAGLCVLPPKQDGSKRPDSASWTQYQSRFPTEAEFDRWYGPRSTRTGIGYVCGRVSGGLELFEFEDPETYRRFLALVAAHDLPDAWERLIAGYFEASPGGGYHVLWRTDEPGPNTALARRPAEPHPIPLVETRGEGGYAVAAPSNGAVHPSGGAYELLLGGVDTIATVSADERETWFALGRMLDEMPAEPYTSASTGGRPGRRPGDDFDARMAWDDLLPRYGWEKVRVQGEATHWRRPGKDHGTSATTNYRGSNLLKVFSTATPLDVARTYTPFGFYAAVEHGGDFAEAARDLAAQGYGDPGAASQGPDRARSRAEGASGGFGGGPRTGPASDSWPPMAALPEAAPSAPTLPAAMVPEPLRPWVLDTADLAKLPAEMVATPVMVAVGAAVGRAVGLRPGRYDEFTVVPNLWGALVARPGWLKTNAVKEAFRPLNRLAAEAAAAHEAAEEEAAVTRERIAAEIGGIKHNMRDAAKKGEALEPFEAMLRAKQLELRAAQPTERRYLTHDATVEKLGELLRDNPRGMLMLRDELSGWLRSLDKPGREGDREFFLEAWNGTGSFTSDRIGRGTIRIPSLTLSLFGGVQPGKLKQLITSAVDGGMGDDGLLQRLQLTAWPERLPGWETPARWPEVAARDRATEIFTALSALVGETVGATAAGVPFLRYSAGAQGVADAWRDALEHRLRGGELDETPAFASHLAKYRSLMPALALLFYLVDRAAKQPGATFGVVGEQYVRLAADWCGFLEAHARKLYAAELHAAASAAHAIAAKIRAGAVFDCQSVRELYRAQWSGLRSPERVLAGLTELTDLGWVRLEFVLTGGRPSQVVHLHPELVSRQASRTVGTDETDESGGDGDA
jgi:putative DNA primase/helicase